MDYLIADEIVSPPAEQCNYTEKPIWLPSYQVNDSRRRISQRVFTRRELGLPERGFVYCCFNANHKILPETFSRWMRILAAAPHSVLLLYAEYEAAEQHLRHEARRRGIEPGRVVFAKRLPFEEYLARYRTADLFLDTLPYNAGATASDALWAGLPVLTCPGRTFASPSARACWPRSSCRN